MCAWNSRFGSPHYIFEDSLGILCNSILFRSRCFCLFDSLCMFWKEVLEFGGLWFCCSWILIIIRSSQDNWLFDKGKGSTRLSRGNGRERLTEQFSSLRYFLSFHRKFEVSFSRVFGLRLSIIAEKRNPSWEVFSLLYPLDSLTTSPFNR